MENKMQFSFNKVEKVTTIYCNYFLKTSLMCVFTLFYFLVAHLGRTCHILECQRQYIPLASHDNETTVL